MVFLPSGKNTQLTCSFKKFYLWNFPEVACMVKGELLEEIWCKCITAICICIELLWEI